MINIVHINNARAARLDRRNDLSEYEQVVRPIIEAIRNEGESALLRYARHFDGLDGHSIRVEADELAQAAEGMCPAIRNAAETAIHNIRQFAAAQLPREHFCEFSPGRRLGWIVRPLDCVGCYVPSGRYPLVSTLLMTAVLAQEAGVPCICVTSPKPSREILGCAHLLGVCEFYRIGGAQALAAMAFGTETVIRADRIVGPGNVYVAAAKKVLAGEVGIDFVAGPTEVVIVAEDGEPRFIAADMLAQAEHDASASAILITTSRSLAAAVGNEIEAQLGDLPTAEIARQAIAGGSAIFVVPDMSTAVELVNRIAPEHLALHDPALLPKIRNAGTIFLGQSSPESAGDYAAGPSHVLPTGGVARLRGGLSTADFVKVVSVQQLSSSALKELAPVITTLARAEGLEAHARSVEIRYAN